MTAKTMFIQTQLATEEMTAGEFSHKSIYRIGGLAALAVVVTALLDIFMMFLPETSVSGPGTRTVIDWFTLFEANSFLALRDLGLLNMVTTSCTVLVFFAIYTAHKRINPMYAGLALILICMGTTIYI